MKWWDQMPWSHPKIPVNWKHTHIHISQTKEFRAFWCIWRCKCLGSLKSFIWYAPYHLEPLYTLYPQCPVFSHPEFPQGALLWWLQWLTATRAGGVQAGGRHPVSILSSLRTHCQGGCDVMAWWLQHPLFTDMIANIFHSHFLVFVSIFILNIFFISHT